MGERQAKEYKPQKQPVTQTNLPGGVGRLVRVKDDVGGVADRVDREHLSEVDPKEADDSLLQVTAPQWL